MRFQKSPSYFVQYIGLKAACTLLRFIPYRLACAFGRGCTATAARLMKKRFERSVRDVQLAFPEKTPLQARQIALNSWRNMGQILAEFVHLSAMTREQFLKKVEVRGVEKLHQARQDKGALIHIGHFTNWEAFGLAAGAVGFEANVMAQKVDNPYVDEETNRLRHVFGGITVYSNHHANPFFTAVRLLKKHQMLGILTDQNAIASEIFMHFLGRVAAISPITALLSIRLQIPVLPVVVTRENGHLICTVEDAVLPPAEYSQENIRAFTRQLTDIYERWIRQNPDNWLWAHNRWKREAEGKRWFEEHPTCHIR